MQTPTGRHYGARFALPLLVTILASQAPDAAADDKVATITLGEVSAQGSRDVGDATRLMRGAAQRELSGLPASSTPTSPKRRIILSLALVRVETKEMPAGASVECSVSATLRTARDGALFAILEGRARAEGGGSREALEAEALRAAVKGTIARIPSALR